MPARTRKIAHDETTRLKIKTSQIVNRLQNHIDGVVELSATQIRAAEILLKKTMPDLQSVSGTLDVVHHRHEEWLAHLEGELGVSTEANAGAVH